MAVDQGALGAARVLPSGRAHRTASLRHVLRTVLPALLQVPRSENAPEYVSVGLRACEVLLDPRAGFASRLSEAGMPTAGGAPRDLAQPRCAADGPRRVVRVSGAACGADQAELARFVKDDARTLVAALTAIAEHCDATVRDRACCPW